MTRTPTILLFLAACLLSATARAAEGDVPIPVGTMATAQVMNDLLIPIGTSARVIVDVNGPLSGATGAYATLPLRLTGTATANLSTGRIELELSTTTITTVSIPCKAYVIDAVDNAFGIAARVEHLAPGTVPTGGATAAPAEAILKIAVPHLAVPKGAAIQVVWMEGIAVPASALPVVSDKPADAAVEAPTSPQAGRTIQIAPGPTVRQEPATP
jgi:hypothetical protein